MSIINLAFPLLATIFSYPQNRRSRGVPIISVPSRLLAEYTTGCCCWPRPQNAKLSACLLVCGSHPGRGQDPAPRTQAVGRKTVSGAASGTLLAAQAPKGEAVGRPHQHSSANDVAQRHRQQVADLRGQHQPAVRRTACSAAVTCDAAPQVAARTPGYWVSTSDQPRSLTELVQLIICVSPNPSAPSASALNSGTGMR